MIITQTPFRISFFGGGTDYPEYYEEYGGAVLSSSFDKYCYVTVRHLPPFFDYSNQITYGIIERTNTVEEIVHPAVREAMKYLDMRDLRVVYEADLPAKSGLGSSSAFAVGMLSAFYALKEKYVDKRTLADDAIYLERTLCAEAGGVQDQIAVAFGGLNRIDFNSDGYTVKPIIISKERKALLNRNLMLFFTGFSRISADIAVAQRKSIKDKREYLKEMQDMVSEAERILVDKDKDLGDFGQMLHQEWMLKRALTDKVSNEYIDSLYDKALKAGARGGKLLGAGGGGFILFYVDEDKRESVLNALSDLLYVPFKFENGGSRILYYQPEDYQIRG